MKDYILNTGDAEAERLDLVESMFGGASREFLKAVGLREGQRILDIGCGTGTLTCWIAQAVRGGGQVTAIDADANQLALASKAAGEQGLKNINFLKCDFGSDEPDLREFDLVHCRFLLMHVLDADPVVKAMVRAAKPGGIVACEETVASSAFTSPHQKAVSRMNDLFRQMGKQRALDFDMGDRLFGLIEQHAERIIFARYVQPMIPLPEAKRFLMLAANELKGVLLASGLSTHSEADSLLRAVESMNPDGEGYYAPGRIAQVAGIVV